jgi:hypothetical protein
VNATPVTLRLHPDQLHALDSWRAGQKDHPGRPEAIRRLLQQALARGPRATPGPHKKRRASVI